MVKNVHISIEWNLLYLQLRFILLTLKHQAVSLVKWKRYTKPLVLIHLTTKLCIQNTEPIFVIGYKYTITHSVMDHLVINYRMYHFVVSIFPHITHFFFYWTVSRDEMKANGKEYWHSSYAFKQLSGFYFTHVNWKLWKFKVFMDIINILCKA